MYCLGVICSRDCIDQNTHLSRDTTYPQSSMSGHNTLFAVMDVNAYTKRSGIKGVTHKNPNNSEHR